MFTTKLIVEGASIADDTILFPIDKKNCYIKVKFTNQVKRVFIDGNELGLIDNSISFYTFGLQKVKVLSLLYANADNISSLNTFYHFKVHVEIPELNFGQLAYTTHKHVNKHLIDSIYFNEE